MKSAGFAKWAKIPWVYFFIINSCCFLICQQCPAFMHFNPDTKQCDWPESAGCLAPISLAPASSSSQSPSSSIATTASTTAPSQCVCITRHVMSPHPTDCNSYCLCYDTEPVEINCPPGLHFNPTLLVCDWPNNAGCDVMSTSSTPMTCKCISVYYYFFHFKNCRVMGWRPQPT